tara:strand:+ start:22846 stop:23505 length:660 start_codon:yes stop_codon:yes gene_type:complete
MTKYIKPDFIDSFINDTDKLIKNLFGIITTTPRKIQFSEKAKKYKDTKLTKEQKEHSASLMRINHSGEVCAQALYMGQALTSNAPDVTKKLKNAALEEEDHLAWCAKRLEELNSHASYTNSFWFLGSLFLGITAGITGDKYSLGFLAETERQVANHLTNHLEDLPEHDYKSHDIITQMRIDETAHAQLAIKSGSVELPDFIKYLMKISSKIMTSTTYYI